MLPTAFNFRALGLLAAVAITPEIMNIIINAQPLLDFLEVDQRYNGVKNIWKIILNKIFPLRKLTQEEY